MSVAALYRKADVLPTRNLPLLEPRQDLFCQHARDRNGRCRGGRWRVADMQHSGAFREEKIMHQRAVAQNRLGAYAGHPRLKVRQRKAWAVFAALGEITLLPQG